jgi:hypothetical protein
MNELLAIGIGTAPKVRIEVRANKKCVGFKERRLAEQTLLTLSGPAAEYINESAAVRLME